MLERDHTRLRGWTARNAARPPSSDSRQFVPTIGVRPLSNSMKKSICRDIKAAMLCCTAAAAAATVLGAMGHEAASAIPALIEATEDSDEDVRGRAFWSLREIRALARVA